MEGSQHGAAIQEDSYKCFNMLSAIVFFGQLTMFTISPLCFSPSLHFLAYKMTGLDDAF